MPSFDLAEQDTRAPGIESAGNLYLDQRPAQTVTPDTRHGVYHLKKYAYKDLIFHKDANGHYDLASFADIYTKTTNNGFWEMINALAVNLGYTTNSAGERKDKVRDQSYNYVLPLTRLADGKYYSDSWRWLVFSNYTFLNYTKKRISWPADGGGDTYTQYVDTQNEIYVVSPTTYSNDKPFNFEVKAHMVLDYGIQIADKEWLPHELYYSNLWIRKVNDEDENLHTLDLDRTCPIFKKSEAQKITDLIRAGYSTQQKNNERYQDQKQHMDYTFDGKWETYKTLVDGDYPIYQHPYNVPRPGEPCMIVLSVQWQDVVINKNGEEWKRYTISSPCVYSVYRFPPSYHGAKVLPYDTKNQRTF